MKEQLSLDSQLHLDLKLEILSCFYDGASMKFFRSIFNLDGSLQWEGPFNKV